MEKSNYSHKIAPKIGVVLSSGGLKPISSLALFEFLNEEEIGIDLLAGCSGGGIMAAFRSIGYDSAQIIEATKEFLSQNAFEKIDYQTLLNIARLPYGKFDLSKGLLKRKLSLQMCRKLFGEIRLEDLQLKTLLQTTDIQNGEGVILEQSLLAEAVYASAAMYPLLPPICIEGRWLVDGVFSSPLPVLEAVKRHMDVIIVMLFHENLLPQPKRFMEGFSNITRAFSLSLIKNQLSLAIDMHHYEIVVINVPFDKNISMSDPAQISSLIELGRKSVDQKKEEILNAIKNFRPNVQI